MISFYENYFKRPNLTLKFGTLEIETHSKEKRYPKYLHSSSGDYFGKSSRFTAKYLSNQIWLQYTFGVKVPSGLIS